jgi:hypothetical protein
MRLSLLGSQMTLVMDYMESLGFARLIQTCVAFLCTVDHRSRMARIYAGRNEDTF